MSIYLMLITIILFRTKQSELEGEVFDILVSFTDFISFKEMLLDYKAVCMFYFLLLEAKSLGLLHSLCHSLTTNQ